MFCAYMRPRYQVGVYRTIGPLVGLSVQKLNTNAYFMYAYCCMPIFVCGGTVA